MIKCDLELKCLSERGRLDMKIRNAIVTADKTKITKLEVPVGARNFWKWIDKKIAGFKDRPRLSIKERGTLPKYKLDKSAVLSYSGGAESTLIHTIMPTIPRFTFERIRHNWWYDPLPVTGVYAILGAGLGFSTTFFGEELEAEDSLMTRKTDAFHAQFFEGHSEFAERWTEYTNGAYFLSPVAAMKKQQIIYRLNESGIKWCSCWKSNTKWCQRCGKCAEAYMLCIFNKQKPPFGYLL